MEITPVTSVPRELGPTVRLSTGWEMPRLGFGVYQNPDCYPSCITALQAGYRHIDTARYYKNEADVGRAVRDSGVPREEIFLISKIMHQDFGYESTFRCVDESLERMGISYLDLYLIHSPIGGKQPRLETWRALVDLKKTGKVRSVGVSNYNVEHLEEIRQAGFEFPSINQIEMHPFCQHKPIVDYCRKHGILVQAYCPLVKGKLDHPIFVDIAIKHIKSPAQILIRWSLQNGFSPLPKSASPQRIYENTQVFDFELDDEDMIRLNALDKGTDGSVDWNPVSGHSFLYPNL